MRATLIAGLVSLVVLTGCSSSPDDGTSTTSTPQPSSVPLVSTDDLPPAQPNEVHLFGINDLHGNLEPPSGSNGKIGGYAAGGAVYLATHLAKLRAAYPNSALLAAGDNISASPLISALFHDEPTVTFLNSIGVAASSVGNHEFDHGVLELARIQQGGCAPTGCEPGEPFTGAAFPYLAANVTIAEGQLPPALKPWTIVEAGGHKIGVVGVVTTDTANIVLPEGIRGYSFTDEVEAINKYVPEMKAAGAETVVALMHDGGAQQTESEGPLDYNGCANVSGSVNDFATKTDPAVKVLITGHTHQPYVCEIGGKVVTQASSFGRLVTDISVQFGAEVTVKAVNRVVTQDVPADEATAKLVDFYRDQAKPRAGRVVGTITADLSHNPGPSGDSTLGDVIADSMLTATAPAGAVAAFTNPGGVRADLKGGQVTYGDIYTVQPFGNQVVTLTLTGQQIIALLEQQWDNVSKTAVLAPAGITYAYLDSAPVGAKVVEDSIRIAGQPLNPVATYRISTNNFLASGGDGFAVFKQGTDLTVGPIDLDAMEAYFAATGTIAPPPSRIEKR